MYSNRQVFFYIVKGYKQLFLLLEIWDVKEKYPKTQDYHSNIKECCITNCKALMIATSIFYRFDVQLQPIALLWRQKIWQTGTATPTHQMSLQAIVATTPIR